LRFEKGLIRQLLSEDVMQESVIYQDILQKGNKQGEERVIIRLLNRLLGEIDLVLLERIKSLSVDKLDLLAEALLDFSNVSDLVTWLDRDISS
jgi:predicted transposase YdaD